MKKIVIFIITFIIYLIPVKAIDINSKSAIMYNMNDDSIIYEKNIYDKSSIASLTKIMTAIITIENANLDDTVVISSKAFNGLDGYALAGFKVGDKVTIRDLLYGLILPSGAECGNMLSLSVTDSPDDFINLMNDKVSELKLNNTRFDNVIGRDSTNNYSTAYDLSIILKYALKNDTFREIFTSMNYTTSNGLKLSRTIDKYANGIDVSIIKGDKTGHTNNAGYCLSSISSIDGVDYLIITLNAETTSEFINDHINLYNYYSTNYSYRNILNKKQYLLSIPIKNGKKEKIDIYSNKEIKKYLLNEINLDDIKYEYDGIDIITKKVKLNDKLGTISIKYNGELLDTYDIYLNEKIEYKMELYLKILIIIIPILLILIIRKITKKNKKSIMKNL